MKKFKKVSNENIKKGDKVRLITPLRDSENDVMTVKYTRETPKQIVIYFETWETTRTNGEKMKVENYSERGKKGKMFDVLIEENKRQEKSATYDIAKKYGKML